MKTFGEYLDDSPLGGAPANAQVSVCKAHGNFLSRKYVFGAREVWTPCGECREAANQLEQQAYLREMQQKRLDSIFARAAIPDRFKDRTLDNYRPTLDRQRQNLAVVQKYAAEFEDNLRKGRCLVMCGNYGTGKNHMAVGIAKVIMARGHTVLFATAKEAIGAIRSTWSKDSPRTEREVMARFAEVDLLIIDEVGVQRGTEDERIELFEIINRRYLGQKPTLVLSNLSPDGVKKFIGERSFDRLRENGGALLIFDWGSHRGTRGGGQ